MLAMCEALGLECLSWPGEPAGARLADADWIVDGIAGTGLRGPLRATLAEIVKAMNESAGRTIAVDVPSGVGDGFREGDPAVRAEITLTMGLPKTCLYLPRARSLCGRIIVVPVGFPPALTESADIPGELLTRVSWMDRVRPVPPDTHKNRRGHLAVFAGSSGTTGAAWLSASAAARCRVGLVTLFADPQAYPVLAPKLASVMCRPWDGSSIPAGWNPEAFSAVLAGPGWGTSEAKERLLESLLPLPQGGVIDADGLALLKRILDRSKTTLGGRWVLTPHPGEFSRLTGVAKDDVLDDPVRHALSFSARVGAVVVLKGHSTVVASPDGKYWVLDGANPALATGGAGDVLAGIIAGGHATGLGALDAALFGVALHSDVARLAARRVGWFLAEDLVPLLSTVLGHAARRGTRYRGAAP
jgi:NAD(P)H-hydrate epimerase